MRYAFVDESEASGRYIVAAVLVDASHLAELRDVLRGRRTGGHRRIHFHQESNGDRRALLDWFAALPISAVVVVAARTQGVDRRTARDRALGRVVVECQTRGVASLVIESRQDDRDDRRTIATWRKPTPHLVFDHVRGDAEPCLWLADGFAWAYNKRGDWANRVAKIVDRIDV